MNEQKNLFRYLLEAIDQYQAERRKNAPAEGSSTQSSNRFVRILKWLTPNGGTLLLVALLIATQSVWAKPLQSALNAPGASATTVNYQGSLADSGGTPLTGTYAMSFTLYDDPTSGSVMWGPESHPAVQVNEGLFNVGLGSQTVGGIPTTTWDGDRYLEIIVGGETLAPRELIRSVPVAGMALTVPDGAIGSQHIAPTVFEAYLSAETPFGSDPTEIMSLEIEFPLDGAYIIFVSVTSKIDLINISNSRVYSYLEDENGVKLPGSKLYTHHSAEGNPGTHTGSVSFVGYFSAGTHTIKLISYATGYLSGVMRTAHIIAIPFVQSP